MAYTVVVNLLSIQAEDLKRAGNSLNAIKYPPTACDDGYMASIEVVYHMHCLNLLRKSTFYNHGYYENDPVYDDPFLSSDIRIGKATAIDISHFVVSGTSKCSPPSK